MFVVSVFVLLGYTLQKNKLEAQWAEPVSLTFQSIGGNFIQNLPQVLPTKLLFIWLLGFRREDFLLEITRNKNCLWLPCLLTDRDETNNIYRRMSIYIFYQVLVHLAMRFQRRRFFQKQELPVAAMLVSGSGRNEQSLQRTVHRCFLPSFGSFAHAVLEENIFLKIDQSETRIVCGGHVC